MTNEELSNYIKELNPNLEFEEEGNIPRLIVEAADFRQLMETLRSDEKTLLDYMYCLSGVDQPEHLEVHYHMRSTSLGHEIVIKAKTVDRENPEIPTISDIWRTAEFHEREAYDLYGIVFTNHPDLRRILLEDDREGWPLRKDFEDPINMIAY